MQELFIALLCAVLAAAVLSLTESYGARKKIGHWAQIIWFGLTAVMMATPWVTDNLRTDLESSTLIAFQALRILMVLASVLLIRVNYRELYPRRQSRSTTRA